LIVEYVINIEIDNNSIDNNSIDNNSIDELQDNNNYNTPRRINNNLDNNLDYNLDNNLDNIDELALFSTSLINKEPNTFKEAINSTEANN
jgi:hypothetical protein